MFGEGRQENTDEYPPTIKLVLVLGQSLVDECYNRYYAKAQILSGELSAAYDEVLDDVDVLAMPTIWQTTHERLEDAFQSQLINQAINMIGNILPLDITGHPAISVPAETNDEGPPVGLMFVGEKFDHSTVLPAGHAFEYNHD